MKIGIDFGTEFCRAGYVDQRGVFRVIENAEGELATPSAVFFETDGGVCVGSAARAEGALLPEYLCDCVKSKLGYPDYSFSADGEEYSAAAVSCLILQRLITDAEAYLDEPIEEAVITCPAYFRADSKAALIFAAENVQLSDGSMLKVSNILAEPIAAAIAYGKTEQEPKEKTVLIYDLGGTFDCAVVKFDFRNDEGKAGIVTIYGDHMLGGREWDEVLKGLVIRKFCDSTGADEYEMYEDTEVNEWCSEYIEKAKKTLSQQESAILVLRYNGDKERIVITREEFEAETKHLLEQTVMLVDKMLEENGMSMDDIDEILLVGGSTRMPQVRERLELEYSRPIVSHYAGEAVVMGAAMVADALQKENYEAPRERSELVGDANVD